MTKPHVRCIDCKHYDFAVDEFVVNAYGGECQHATCFSSDDWSPTHGWVRGKRVDGCGTLNRGGDCPYFKRKLPLWAILAVVAVVLIVFSVVCEGCR